MSKKNRVTSLDFGIWLCIVGGTESVRGFPTVNRTVIKNPSSGILSLLRLQKHSGALTGVTYTSVTSLDVDLRKWKTAIYFVILVRKRIKQIFSGSFVKQFLTLFPVYQVTIISQIKIVKFSHFKVRGFEKFLKCENLTILIWEIIVINGK
jgi:hypothetical protein